MSVSYVSIVRSNPDFMPLVLFITTLFFSTTPHNVSVRISSTCAQGGEIHLAVYSSAADFEAKRAVTSLIQACIGSTVDLEVTLPATGTYVLAAYHDVNGNGKLDRNFFGIPTEPYGFSQAPTSKWQEPEFADIAANFDATKVAAKLELKRWKEY